VVSLCSCDGEKGGSLKCLNPRENDPFGGSGWGGGGGGGKRKKERKGKDESLGRMPPTTKVSFPEAEKGEKKGGRERESFFGSQKKSSIQSEGKKRGEKKKRGEGMVNARNLVV